MTRERAIKEARNYVDDKVYILVSLPRTNGFCELIQCVSYNGLTTYSIITNTTILRFGENLTKAKEELAFLIRQRAKNPEEYAKEIHIMTRDEINQNIITFVFNGGYDSDDYESFKTDYGWKKWMNAYTDADDMEVYSEAELKEINEILKEGFKMAFDEDEKKKLLKEAFMKYGLEERKMYSKEALEAIYTNSSGIEDYLPNEMWSLFDFLYDCYTETDDKEDIEQYSKEIEENKVKDVEGEYWKKELSNGSFLFCSIPSY